MRRYLRLLWLSLRTSLLLGVQYRWNFLTQGGAQLLWAGLASLPLWIAFQSRAAATGSPLGAAEINGWGLYPAAMVFAVFLLLKAVLDGAINPSLAAVVEQIRSGALDFTLLKPADAQFLVSTARFEVWHITEALGALALLVFAALRHHAAGGPLPGALNILTALVLLGCAVAMLYAVWILVICAAFFVVKIDNLSFLFTSLFDFARWPRVVFRGAYHVLFTYIIPLTVMTSFPVDALLAQLSAAQAAWAVSGAAILVVGSRLLWLRALGKYTSASS